MEKKHFPGTHEGPRGMLFYCVKILSDRGRKMPGHLFNHRFNAKGKRSVYNQIIRKTFQHTYLKKFSIKSKLIFLLSLKNLNLPSINK